MKKFDAKIGKCKYCKSDKLKLSLAKDCLTEIVHCGKCKKFFNRSEVIKIRWYITLCPYCKKYLADCGYVGCMYCGKKLKKPLIKVKMED